MANTQVYDYLIVGSGIAGLYTALLAREHGSVLILTKGSIEDCNTRYAQGGIAAAVGPGDSPELHLQDTLAAGAGLCEPDVVRILAQEGPQAIADLIRLGVAFDTMHGEIALTREGAHSVSRVLHAGGDATGAHIELTLANLARMSRIHVREYVMAIRILVEGGVAVGVEAMDCRTGATSELRGRFIILATGGAGHLYRYTTNPDVATGDGVALAFQAGAQVMDMEFYQFHPTALRLPRAPPFLISEAVRGEGGILHNGKGEPFMKRHHPQGDLAPRDVVARAIVEEMRETASDHVLLDMTHLPGDRVATRFPTIYRSCLQYGLNITKAPIPVAPAAHYMMGGVKVNSWGETSLPGLYACGEVACSGVHGANRLASNSLLDTVVFGRRLVLGTLGQEDKENPPAGEPFVVEVQDLAMPCGAIPPLSLASLQNLMWECAGITRSGPQLLGAARMLSVWNRLLPRAQDRPSQELAHLVQVGRFVVEAALARRESRGAHYRSDFPDPSPEWKRHIILAQGQE